ncbi:hypothetical protein MJN85_32790, partial [Salmonella enterica subsp. enterica serovar Anatum]|nr:hypothetical protein [Salmonella enterica subsp. enterica serovar Anatum]
KQYDRVRFMAQYQELKKRNIEFVVASGNQYYQLISFFPELKDKAYSQAHLPISQQQTAIGHAVRFVYLMTGVAHLARLSNDE